MNTIKTWQERAGVPDYEFPNFADWLAWNIDPPKSLSEYAQMAFKAGRSVRTTQQTPDAQSLAGENVHTDADLPLTMSVFGTREALEVERVRREAKPAPAGDAMEPDYNYDPDISIQRSLLSAACQELREYAIPAGCDDQVVLNLEAAMRQKGTTQ